MTSLKMKLSLNLTKGIPNNKLYGGKMQADYTFLSVKDVAKIMGISLPTARKLFEKRDFPAIRAGRRIRVIEEAFRQYIMHRHS